MKAIVRLHLLIASYLVFSCKSEPRIPFYQHPHALGDSIVNRYNPHKLEKARINFCDIFPFDWDSIIAVPAYFEYGQLKELNLTNLRSVKSDLVNYTYRDDITSLLFTKKATIVRYDRVYNVPISFTSLINDTSNFPIITRSKCASLFIKKVKGYKQEYRFTYK